MTITDKLLLPEDVVIVPIEHLSDDIRSQLACVDGDHAITRHLIRGGSKIVSCDVAKFLQLFLVPTTIIDAVVQHSQINMTDPEEILVDVFPIIQLLIKDQLLVSAGALLASPIVPTLENGQLFADFTIQSCVQIQEDSEIYQVRSRDGEECALKIARPETRYKIKEMIEREASVLRHLDGKVNPKLLGSGAFDGRQYLIMEWCPGVTASKAVLDLQKGPVQLGGRKRHLRLCCAILEAYAHLHSQYIIHGDIHPRNVLVTNNGDVKIIDYGVAYVTTETGKCSAPPRWGIGFYLEPEYAEAYLSNLLPPLSSFLGEQYALAAMLYFLLTNSHYYPFSLEKEAMMQQIAEKAPLAFSLLGIAPWLELEDVLSKALSKRPEMRFSSVTQFSQRMRDIEALEREELIPSRQRNSSSYMAADRLLKRVLKRVEFNNEVRIDTATTSSVNYGAAGIAYALYRISCIRGDLSLLSSADIWINRASQNINNNHAFYNSELGISSDTIGYISPYHTGSGIHTVQAFISHAMGDFDSQREAIEHFLLASKAPCENLDLTLGYSGSLLICSLLLDTIHDSASQSRAFLQDFGKGVMQHIWDRIDAFPPIRNCSDLTFLGIAHGWAGILYAVMRWCQSSEVPIPMNLKARLQELANCGESRGRGIRWRRSIRTIENSQLSCYLSGWCNGSAGFVHLWTLAYHMFQKSEYISLAEKAAWNIWDEPENVGDLCCGLSGQAYALLNLYKYTGENNWLHRAQALANQAAINIGNTFRGNDDMSRTLPSLRNSLYKGEIGVALLAAEFYYPEMSSMPFFESEYGGPKFGV